MKKTLSFKVHTPNLLREIADNAIDRKCGVLKIPLNVFQTLLGRVAERASQLNDAKLNDLMCDLTLYEIADPSSKEYDPGRVKKIKALCRKKAL